MDSDLVRGYVRRKQKTIWGTVILLLILAFEFYYLNCYSIYIAGFCELTFLFIVLAIVVANIGFYFGGKKDKSSTKEEQNQEKPPSKID
jgi:hypothetical protein